MEFSKTGPGSEPAGEPGQGPKGSRERTGGQKEGKDEGEEERGDRRHCHPSLGRNGSCWTLAHWPVPVLSSAPAHPVGPDDCPVRHGPHVAKAAEAHGMKSQLSRTEPGWPPSTA